MALIRMQWYSYLIWKPLRGSNRSYAMATRRFTAVIYWEADDQGVEGVYVAECPEVGTASQGDSVEEALANLKEATELYLEESRPQSITSS